MALKGFFGVVALGLLIPFLYERSAVLSFFYKNTPARLHRTNSLGKYEIKFEDRMRSCEDVFLLEEHHLAIIACDAGRERWNTVMGVFLEGEVTNADLWAYDYESASKPDAESLTRIKLTDFASAQDFHTLGLAFHKETSTLYVTNHAKAGPRIELFKLDIASFTAKHIRTIEHPLIHAPNAIALISDKELYVTNAHYFTRAQSKFLSLLETYLSLPLGPVVHVSLQHPEVKATVVARVPFANGIEVLNSSTVAVSSTSSGTVFLFNTPDKLTFENPTKIRVPFLPDNLSWANGKLLIAGHPFVPACNKFAETRHICNDPSELEAASPEMKEYCAKGEATSAVAEWSEEGGLKYLYSSTEYPTSTTAVKDAKRGVGIITGLYANGILVWREKE
ncbi:hypothetical protein NW755_008865 [Fusarium falciforme]|uniref:Serum paraoxonase/lactonase 3 n=1 Tax=Fusarium falciforme TaxID=195108 RepID=A0A9W8R1E2_9HYPO|nr:hypothetical protein NW755_008865 [Fusarium falciforme]KAJ4249185.1 hypothetical protein NW757_007761 [Fusarium falciforme]